MSEPPLKAPSTPSIPTATVRKRVRASAVCVKDDALLCVRLRDPITRVARLFVPGGQLEPGETYAEAAQREALEETGYRVTIDVESELAAVYVYPWAGVDVECETHFFQATLTSADAPQPVDDAAYHEGVVWLPLASLEALAFHTPIYDAVCRLLKDPGGTGS